MSPERSLGKDTCSGPTGENHRLPELSDTRVLRAWVVLECGEGVSSNQTEVHDYPYRDRPVPPRKNDSDVTTDQLTWEDTFL